MRQILLKLVLMAFTLLLTISFAAAQTRTLTGNVVDEQNEPVVGAMVALDGTTRVVLTATDGSFSLTGVSSNQSITVSILGYVAQTIAVGTNNSLHIIMTSDTRMLDDVVVIGYGVQRKSDVTGSITSVKSEAIASRSVENIQQAMQGKAAGVMVMAGSAAPGTSPSVRIRGISSNSAGASEPLYIVDGLKVSDIAYLDPNNVQSMEILKDGASAAIYGVEAGNGVVLITTRNGTKGTSKIFYDLNYGITSLAKQPELMNAKQYVDYNKTAGNSLVDDWDGKIDTNWSEALYGEGGSFQRHTMGFEGGNDHGTIFSSIGYMKNDGMYYGDKDYMNRISFQLNATYNIKPWLEFSSNNTIDNTQYSNMGSAINKQGWNSVYYYDPLTPLFFDKDNLPNYMTDLIASRGDEMFMKNEEGDYAAVPKYNADNTNPMTWYYSHDVKNRNFNVKGATALNLKPLKGLVITSRLGYRLDSRSSQTYGVPVYFSISPRTKLTYSSSTDSSRFYEWENFVNYNRTLNKHNVYAMAGMSYSDNWGTYTRGSTDQFTNNADNFHYLDYSANGAIDGVGGRVNESRKISYFGRVGYSYDDCYMIQANFRADAFDSSKLSKENRWGYFPSVSIGWVVSNERFMENVSQAAISYLKFRASYGINGNINALGSYQYASSLSMADYYPIDGSLINTISPSSVLANPTLNWEESRQVDVGFDARFLNNRLTFTADFYNKNTTGQLVSITPPLSTGTTNMTKNVGEVNNRGLEFDLGWQDRRGDFTYGVSANMATLRNRVTRLDEVEKPIDTGGNGFTFFYKGQPVWSYYGYEYLGPDATTGIAKYKDQTGEGTINEADKVFLGNALPDFYYGITLTAAYKGLDFLVFGSGSQGGQLCMNVRGAFTANQLAEFWTESWAVKGAGAKYPTPTRSDDYFSKSSAALQSGSYFKVKQLQLGYTIPEQITSKVEISRLRLFVSLDNFFTFTKYPGSDPETVAANGAMGMDYGDFPTPKTLTFGLNLSF